MIAFTCPFCGNTVDPDGKGTWQRIDGWQRIAGVRASGKHGGSDISLRRTRQEWAHGSCVKLARDGRIGQESLL